MGIHSWDASSYKRLFGLSAREKTTKEQRDLLRSICVNICCNLVAEDKGIPMLDGKGMIWATDCSYPEFVAYLKSQDMLPLPKPW